MWISDREERGSEDDKLKGHGKKEKKPQDGEEDDDCSNDDEEEGNSEKMKIAWRYKGMKKLGSHVGVGLTLNKASTLPSISPLLTESPKQNQLSFCNTFDLTKRIPDAVLDSASLWPVDVSKLSLYDNLDRINENEGRNVYDHILSEIRNAISENSQMVSQNVLRVAIHSIASPMWPNASVEELFKFFHALRGILRSSNGTAVVTIPAYLYASHNSGLSDLHSSPLIRRVSHMCDALVGVESFAGSPKTCNTLYSAHYNGLFHVYKLPTLNSLLAPATKLSILSNGGGNQLGFKLRRKKFSIETFHLPPEGGVGERRVGGSSEVENAHENLKKPNVTEKNDDVSTFFPKKFGPRTGGFNIKSARLHHGKMGTAEETLEF
ncbi:hypothetical protein G9A89_006249 [Geosiphon pyriformis]|nr:hypothetical protein G9A89_006249 [Geosiphon pyriformis]